MPKVTIWIREGEDYKKWQAIKNKPQWITTALNTSLVDMAINQADKPPLKPRTHNASSWCKEHDMEKQYCSNMKHTGVK